MGLYIGDVAKIEITGSVDGREVIRRATLRPMTKDRRFVAYWVSGVGKPLVSERGKPSRGRPDVMAYDADGKPLPLRFPDFGPPPAGSDVADFNPADAPRLGEPIRTGEERKSGAPGALPAGEVLLSFHGKDGFVGIVTGFRDPDSGEVTNSRRGNRAYKLPFQESPGRRAW